MPFPLSERLLTALDRSPQTLGQLAAEFRTIIPPEYAIQQRRKEVAKRSSSSKRPVTLTEEIRVGARSMVRDSLHELKGHGFADRVNGFWALTSEGQAIGERVCPRVGCENKIGFSRRRKWCTPRCQRRADYSIALGLTARLTELEGRVDRMELTLVKLVTE